jgi:hypothetical protein
MAALGPAPEIVSKDKSTSALLAARSASSRAAAESSVSPPGRSRFEPAQETHHGRPVASLRRAVSRQLDRVLHRLGQDRGIEQRRNRRPGTFERAENCRHAAIGIDRNLAPAQRFKRGHEGISGARRTPSPRCATRSGVTFSGAMKRSALPSAWTSAKASATGVRSTSLPRRLKSHATDRARRSPPHQGSFP